MGAIISKKHYYSRPHLLLPKLFPEEPHKTKRSSESNSQIIWGIQNGAYML